MLKMNKRNLRKLGVFVPETGEQYVFQLSKDGKVKIEQRAPSLDSSILYK